jgi:hypothetical protein
MTCRLGWARGCFGNPRRDAITDAVFPPEYPMALAARQQCGNRALNFSMY